MKEKLMTNARLWLVLGALACASSAAAFQGTYTYKLILRDDYGLFPLSGADNASVSQTFTVEVFNSNGEKVTATAADVSIGGNTGHNCSLSVSVGEGTGYATVGEQLTLVVTTKYDGTERFRSSKVLPPVGGMFGIANAPVGAFWSDSSDVDNGWDVWCREIERSIPGSISIGGHDEDYDGDGFTNLSEYRFGTDPTGKFPAEYFAGKPEVSIVEQDGILKVDFNYGWGGHVYSVRAIEGIEPVGRDGNDLPLYESAASLESGDSCGMYFYDAENSGMKTFFVKKPELDGTYLIGLAVDGQLLEYIKVGEESPGSVTVSPGYPIEYGSEAEAMSAKAVATVAPTEAVGAVLTGEGMTNGYNAAFTAEVREKDGKWLLVAELTPQAWTNLMENATAATRQLPVGEIARLESEAAMNVVLSGCTPGFYYSLNSGAELTGIAPDAETGNLGVLCGADGIVEFPKVSKPSEAAGFYKVVTNVK